MNARTAAYHDSILALPLLDRFEGARVSGYEYYRWSEEHQIPNWRGHKHDYMSEGSGAVVGNRQSMALIPTIYSDLVAHGIGDVVPYDATPFNAFRLLVNEVRAARLAAPEIPLAPWVYASCYGNLDGTPAGDFAQWPGLWSEMVLHAGLSGVETLFFSNPTGLCDPVRLAADTDRMARALTVLDDVLGEDAIDATFPNLFAPWDAPVVITGARLAGRKLWRVTLDLQEGESLESRVLAQAPLVLESRDRKSGARALWVFSDDAQWLLGAEPDPLSACGLWVEAELDAPEPFVFPMACGASDFSQSWAYAWKGANAEFYENIVDAYVMTYDGQQGTQMDAALAWARLEGHPEGRRAVLTRGWSNETIPHRHPKDVCIDANSDSTQYWSIWWDNGADSASVQVGQFLADLESLGGTIDVWGGDREEGCSMWAINHSLRDSSAQAKEDHWQALEDDSRYGYLEAGGVYEQLVAWGFGEGDRLVETVFHWGHSSQNYLVWNALMDTRTAGYQNQAFGDPVLAQFPHARVSNYGDFRWSPDRAIPDSWGHDFMSVGSGAVVGNHQSRSFYPVMQSGICRFGPDHDQPYSPTPFNALRYVLNNLHAMALADPRTPIQPWISSSYGYLWKEGAGETYVRTRDMEIWSELCTEQIIHMGMSTGPRGIEEFLLFNPVMDYGREDPDPVELAKNDRRTAMSLLALDELAGCKRRSPRVSRLVPWTSPFIISRMAVNGQTVWRVTLELDIGENYEVVEEIEHRIKSHSPPVLEAKMSDSGAVCRLTFPSESAFHAGLARELSAQGIWVVANGDAAEPRVMWRRPEKAMAGPPR